MDFPWIFVQSEQNMSQQEFQLCLPIPVHVLITIQPTINLHNFSYITILTFTHLFKIHNSFLNEFLISLVYF